MKSQIFIMTSSDDAHAIFLRDKMVKMGAHVFQFDTDRLNRYDIDLRVPPSSFSIRNRRTRDSILGSDISAVWYRRPGPDKSMDDKLNEEALRFIRGETKEWVKSITMALTDAFWVVAPWTLYAARLKARQLSVAHNVGLRVPKTVITTDRRIVRDLYDECPSGIVAKSLRAPYVESRDAYFTLSTQSITRADLGDPTLYICPTVFQEKVDTTCELRIVAIGRRLFAFKAVSKLKERPLDIRACGLKGIEYSACEIPRTLHTKIVRMLDHFDLPFSSMDFLVDRANREYFVDLNPNGQWLWLEFLTGTPLSDHFAEMLMTRKIPK